MIRYPYNFLHNRLGGAFFDATARLYKFLGSICLETVLSLNFHFDGYPLFPSCGADNHRMTLPSFPQEKRTTVPQDCNHKQGDGK